MLLDNWVSVTEAAQIMGCTESHARLLCARGDLQARKIGARMWVVHKRSAEKYAEKPRGVGRPRKFRDSEKN